MPEAGDMNLAFLSESERALILEVLHRDELLRQAEEQRVRKLKVELLDIRRKGAKRGSGRYSQRSCGRCQETLSRLTVGSNQCKACKHHVCQSCRTVHSSGTWLCTLCAKESDLKKTTGDWFYDQRVNRFSTKPGHDLVRSSLKKRPLVKKRETAGELLLRSTEISANPPVPRPRQRDQMDNRASPTGDSEVKTQGGVKPQPSDTESTETDSRSSSRTETSGSGTPDTARGGKAKVGSSPAGSNVSSLNVAGKADNVSIRSASSEATTASEKQRSCLTPESNGTDVERIFKKSIRRSQKPPEHTSALDLSEEGGRTSSASMGNRSRSVPSLDAQGEEEEDEDIDNLVSIHKKKVATSSSSLHSSKSTLGSLMSIYSETGDYDSVEVSGDIVFSLSYDELTNSLIIFIKECYGLAYGDASHQRSNPYVKCYLLPEKSRQSKRKTTIKRNTINPVYNETLKYGIIRSQLHTRSLLIAVWHHGRMSRNTFLGEVELSLDCRELDSPQEERVALMGKTASPALASAFAQYKGELVISLKYITPKKPTEDNAKGKKAKTEGGGELHVLIKEAKSLVAMKVGGTSDPFVKGYLFPTNAKSTKRKTSVMKKNLNPHFNHTFVYRDLSLERLKGMCLELTVWDREAMSSNEFLGGVRLSTGTLKIEKVDVEMDSVGEEVSLWQKMMQYPDSWAEGTLPLRCSMGKAKGK